MNTCRRNSACRIAALYRGDPTNRPDPVDPVPVPHPGPRPTIRSDKARWAYRYRRWARYIEWAEANGKEIPEVARRPAWMGGPHDIYGHYGPPQGHEAW